MKKLSTISLFIFGVVVTAILTAGLVFYQDNKTSNSGNKNLIQSAISKNGTSINTTSTVPVFTQNISNNISTSPVSIVKKNLVLNMAEIKKHNNQNDCWMLISGKVYDITSYFGHHPGGNEAMAATCGTDATDAYMTKDPNATSAGSRSAHSSRAQNLLNNYYLGDLNQTIS